MAQKTLVEWRDEADPVRRFLIERTGLAEVGAAALYAEWPIWSRSNGFADMSSTRFGRRVVASGLYKRHETRDGRFYRKQKAA
jgi:phage/plasmid-associated DNA primase